MASLILRYREAEGDARQQIKWLAYVGVVALTALLATLLSFAVFGDPPPPGLPTLISNGLFAVMLWSVVFGIPVACGVAILRYRMYDLDVVVKKTLVALVLAVMLAAVALVAVAVIGRLALGEGTSRSVSLGIGLILGALVVPLLRLSRRIADRLVYGRRASTYEVLATFSSRVGETYSSEDVLPRMAQILLAGSGAASTRVLVKIGGDLNEAARAGDPVGDEHVEAIAFQGDEVGALAVTFPPNDPLDHQRQQLIANLAAQAGPVVRNVRLIEELRASRQRLVAAQDEQRRKIERNIHDGVQQQLVALNVQLGLLARIADREPARAGAMATNLQATATEALEDLRDLARGIYPPVLADHGLVAALEGQARKAAVPTTIEARDIARYERSVESAVYFCTLEALNNVAKYASAAHAAINLEQQDGHLVVHRPRRRERVRPRLHEARDRSAGDGRPTGCDRRRAPRREPAGRRDHRDGHGPDLRSARGVPPRLLEAVGTERGLRDVGGSAALGGARRVLGLLVRGEQQNHHRVGCRQDLPRRVEPVDPRQVDVHQHEIGVQVVRHRYRVLAGLRFTHDLEAVGELHDHARGDPEGLLVVHDEHPNGHLHTPPRPRLAEG